MDSLLGALAIYILPMIACLLYTRDRYKEAMRYTESCGGNYLLPDEEFWFACMWVISVVPMFNFVVMMFVCADVVKR